MNLVIETEWTIKPQSDLVPTEPPVLDDELWAEGEEWARPEEDINDVQPHGLDQYCECSRRLGTSREIKPSYLGYPVSPRSPLGMCH